MAAWSYLYPSNVVSDDDEEETEYCADDADLYHLPDCNFCNPIFIENTGIGNAVYAAQTATAARSICPPLPVTAQ